MVASVGVPSFLLYLPLSQKYLAFRLMGGLNLYKAVYSVSRYELKSLGREFGLESKLRIRIQRFNTGKKPLAQEYVTYNIPKCRQ